MPQTKQEKRKTAIRLYNSAIELHKRELSNALLSEHSKSTCIKRINNLNKLVAATEAKY
jgi:hypothetical protein